MPEYIERESFRKSLLIGSAYLDEDTMMTVVNVLDCFPAADVAPVRHGQWSYYDTYLDGITIFRCTCCGDLQSGRDGWGWKKNYCPNCGAKMDSYKL